MNSKRVVIVGMGCISPLGLNLKDSWDRLHVLENTVSTSNDLKEYKGLNSHLIALIPEFKYPERYTRKVIRTMGSVAILALNATEQALEQADLLDKPDILHSERVGVAYGSSFGSIDPMLDFGDFLKNKEIRNITSSTYIKMMPHTTAVNLSVHFKTMGRLIPTSTACTSGSLSVGLAYEAIKNGSQDIMIAGGAESYNVIQVAIFDTLYATSIKNDTPKLTPAPFDVNRDGLVIGDGAATMVLEEYEHAKARGANILAEVVGFGTNTDGTHVTHPSSEGMLNCINLALLNAKLSPSDIDYINAHGTGTRSGDQAESTATAKLFGSKIPVSSLKSYTGHTLGACGCLESIVTILMMNNDWYIPTLNLVNPDPECGELDYIMKEPRSFSSEFVMNNNFAFGGINTSLIFKRI